MVGESCARRGCGSWSLQHLPHRSAKRADLLCLPPNPVFCLLPRSERHGTAVLAAALPAGRVVVPRLPASAADTLSAASLQVRLTLATHRECVVHRERPSFLPLQRAVASAHATMAMLMTTMMTTTINEYNNNIENNNTIFILFFFTFSSRYYATAAVRE